MILIRRHYQPGGGAKLWLPLGLVGRVGDWSGEPRQPPLIEPDVRFSLIRLSDGVHVRAVAGGT
jgi:hypothetical protein